MDFTTKKWIGAEKTFSSVICNLQPCYLSYFLIHIHISLKVRENGVNYVIFTHFRLFKYIAVIKENSGKYNLLLTEKKYQ